MAGILNWVDGDSNLRDQKLPIATPLKGRGSPKINPRALTSSTLWFNHSKVK